MPGLSFDLDIGETNKVDDAMDFAYDGGDAGMDGDDDFTLDIDDGDDVKDDFDFDINTGANDNGNDDFVLQGYDDVHADTPGTDYNTGPAPKRVRSAFFGRSIKAAERAALRSKPEAADSFVLFEGNDAAVATKQTSRIPGTFGRRNREKGSTLPAYHKKVSHELDSDDELMLDMKEKGYSDRQIADKLSKDGRARYDMKSISTRIMRIRGAQAEHMDYLLKEGYMEWSMDDDQLLMRAYELADIDIRYEIERARAWRFRKVSDYMRRLNKTAIFSANACSDRYIGLVNGTAKIPMDLDDDPLARRAEMDAFIAMREKERNAERAAKEKKEEDARRIKENAKVRQAKKSAAIAARRDNLQKEKANRAVLRATKAQLNSQRAEQNHRKRDERQAKIQAEHAKNKRDRERKARMNDIYGLNVLRTISSRTPDPRARLPIDDLKLLCARGGLDTEDGEEELLESLREADEKLTAWELHNILKEKGIKPGANKLQTRYQLALWSARYCEGLETEDEGEGEEEIDDDGEYDGQGEGLDFGGDADVEHDGDTLEFY